MSNCGVVVRLTAEASTKSSSRSASKERAPTDSRLCTLGLPPPFTSPDLFFMSGDAVLFGCPASRKRSCRPPLAAFHVVLELPLAPRAAECNAGGGTVGFVDAARYTVTISSNDYVF